MMQEIPGDFNAAACPYALSIPEASFSLVPEILLLVRAAGVGSDPQKLARFRALMRARSSLPEAALQTPALKNFSRMLLKVTQASCEACASKLCLLERAATTGTVCATQVPEHTWGADIKTYLPDYVNWDNAGFHARLHDRDYSDVVAGWNDQASYLDHAVEALGSSGEVRHRRKLSLAGIICRTSCLKGTSMVRTS